MIDRDDCAPPPFSLPPLPPPPPPLLGIAPGTLPGGFYVLPAAALAGTLLTTALALSLLRARGHVKPSLLTAACVVTASLQLVADSLLAAEAWTRSTDPIYDLSLIHI